MTNKYSWYAKKDIDLTKYGLSDTKEKYSYYSYMYFSEKMKSSKILIRNSDNLMSFSNITNESLVILSKMLKDGVIYYVENEKYYLDKKITPEEWEAIKKMRGGKNE